MVSAGRRPSDSSPLPCPPPQVKMKVFLEYARAVGPVLSVFICFLYCCQNAAAIGANIWLSDWANDAGLPLNVTQAYVPVRVGVYAALGIAQGETAPRVRISSDPLLGRVDPVRRSLQDRDAWQEIGRASCRERVSSPV